MASSSLDPCGRAHPVVGGFPDGAPTDDHLRARIDVCIASAREHQERGDHEGASAQWRWAAYHINVRELLTARAKHDARVAELRARIGDARHRVLSAVVVSRDPKCSPKDRADAREVLRGEAKRARKHLRRLVESPATSSARLASRGRSRCPRTRRSTSSSSRTSCRRGGDDPPGPPLSPGDAGGWS